MNRKKVKYYVCLPIMFVCLFVLLLGIGTIFLVTLVNEEKVFEILSFRLLLFPVVLPSALFLWTFIAFAQQITFNSVGLEKYLCGIPLKKYKWEDIQDIKIIETAFGISWLIFSKSNLKNHGIDYCRLQPKTIYIAIDDKKLEKIKEFIPQDKVIREHENKWLQ